MPYFYRPVLFISALSLIFGTAPALALAAPNLPFSAGHPQYAAILSTALAQETADDSVAQRNIDEDFDPEDFGLSGVGLLPNNPLYLFKAVRRGWSDAFTTDATEKIENSLRFAAERLLEAEALALRGARESSIAGALEGFRREVERTRARAADAVAELGDTEEGKALAAKMMDAVFKYEKLIGKIEKGTSGRVVSAAAEAKTGAGEALGAAFSFIPSEGASEALTEVLDAQRGSDFKEFKNVEVLKDVEAQVPDAAKPAIRAATERALTRLEDHLTSETGSRSALGDYVQSVGGNEVRHLEVIQNLEVRPLSNEVRATLLSAKEEVLSRAEARLTGLPSEEKQAFLGHLNEGTIENVRVVKELEKNMSGEVLADLANVATEAKQSFAQKIETAATDSTERAKLLKSVEQFHDARSLSVLDEIAALIPPEQQSVFAALKQKAAAEIRNDLSRARNSTQEQAFYKALSGDHPEELSALQTLGVGSVITEGVRTATAEQIKARVGVIQDEARLGKYEEALRIVGDRTGTGFSDAITAVSERRAVFGSRDKAEKKVNAVAAQVEELSGLVDSLPLNLGFGEAGFDESIRTAARLLNSAEARLASAREALARGSFGVAYGDAQEAEFAARDGNNLARAYKAGRRAPETKPPVFTDEEREDEEEMLDEEETAEETEEERITCQAHFEGYVYDSGVSSCQKESATACKNPFVYKTKNECEIGIRAEAPPEREKTRWVEHIWKFSDGVESSMILDRTDSEYLRYIKNIETVCRLTPKQQFVWKSGAGNDSADNWKNFGIPDCSGQAFAPANCGNNICESGETVRNCAKDCSAGKTARDAYSCPGFAYERIGSRGERYCQLNTRTACSFAYPQYLYESSYSPAQCPSDTGGGTATTTAQFGNCGSNTSRTGCEANQDCDWYVPPSGSPYCSLAVRSSWTSHVWRFSDSGTETSSILGRTDREYSEFIASIDAQCKLITRNKFAWKPGAGNDAPNNWQNFGIPDCTGTATNTGTTGGGGYAGDANSCPGFAYSQWDKNGRRYCKLNSEYKCDYTYPSYLVNGPNYKNTNCPSDYIETATTTPTGTPQCSDGRDNDNDGKTDYPDDTSCYGRDDWDEWYPASGTTGGGGGSTTMQECFYPNASKNGAPVGYTVWCESDYVNCHEGSPSGASISTTGVSLGAPSQCERGWTGGASGYCNNNNYCDQWESKTTCPVECANGPGTYTTGTCNSNNFCDTWESAASCPSECGSTTGGGGSTTCDSALFDLLGSGCHQMYYDSSNNPIFCDGPMTKLAKRGDTTTVAGCSTTGGGGGTTSGGTPTIPTGVTATAPSTGNTVEIRWTDASTNETYFKIWRQANNSWAFLTQTSSAPENKSTTGTVMSYSDQNVPSGSVSYQIQACNDTACSQDSSLASVWIAGGGGTTAGYCGDRICQSLESSASCPADCGTTGGGGGTTTNPACSDGRDNDGDGQTDYPADTGCYSATDVDEAYYPTDGGGGGTSTTCDSATTALLGTGCHSMGNAFFNSEMTKYVWPGGSTVLECSTGSISGCSGSGGGSTSGSQCSDGVDNDSDSFIDANDPGCQNGGTSETYYGSGSGSTSCGTGQYWNGTSCVSSSTTSCPSGQYWNGSACVNTSTTDCTSGQYWNGTSCVSSSGGSVWQAFQSWLKGE